MTLVYCKRFLLNCFKLKILSKTLLEALLTQLFLPTYKITVPGTLCRNNLRQSYKSACGIAGEISV